MMAEEKVPSCMNIPEINTNIILPNAEENRESIFADLKIMESQMENNIRKDHVTPISFPNPNSEIIIQNLNRDLMNQSVYLHSTISTLQKDSKINESSIISKKISSFVQITWNINILGLNK